MCGAKVGGLLLAGGKSRRMGGGVKCFLELGDKTLLARTITRARPQTDSLLLSINGDPSRFDSYGLAIAPDIVPDHAGPLAGILSGMEWFAENNPDIEFIASFATDAPFFPGDIVARLHKAMVAENAVLACAMSNGRTHPVFALWSQSLRKQLRHAVIEEEARKIDAWTANFPLATVEFEVAGVDPFFNINRPDDLEEAKALIAEGGVM